MPKESGTKQQATLQSSPLFKRQNGQMPEKAADGPGWVPGQGAWEIQGTQKGPKVWFSHTLGPYF